MTEAHIDVRSDGRWVGITMAGEVDLANVARVEAEIFAPITNQLMMVSIEMSSVTYVDSTGMRLLFRLADRLQVLQIDLEFVASAGSPARRLIERSGLASLAWVRS